MEENYSVGEEEAEVSDAIGEMKLISSDKKVRESPDVVIVEDTDNASTSNQNPTSTPPKAEKEEEGEQDSEQDDPAGKIVIRLCFRMSETHIFVSFMEVESYMAVKLLVVKKLNFTSRGWTGLIS